jgi:uncharacterized protein
LKAKSFKRFFKGFLIALIILSVAAIVYMLQWKEKPVEVTVAKKEPKQIEQPKAIPPKAEKIKPPVNEAQVVPKPPEVKEPVKQKERIVVSKIGKIPLPLRQVVIIIDDIGYDLGPVRELLKIDADITFAILPLCSHTHEAAEMLHDARRETLLHLPMEPASYPREKPGNGALFTDMNDKELLFQLDKDLASVPYISGVNNHMGSKFMSDEEKLTVIFSRLKKKKLFFIDSRTTADTKTAEVSSKVGLPVASRKIFLDNNRDYDEIYKKLMEVARDTGAGNSTPIIIIGHPYPETIRAIKDAASILRSKGVQVVPASRLIKEKAASGSS